jgi:hypothetical protein
MYLYAYNYRPACFSDNGSRETRSQIAHGVQGLHRPASPPIARGRPFGSLVGACGGNAASPLADFVEQVG